MLRKFIFLFVLCNFSDSAWSDCRTMIGYYSGPRALGSIAYCGKVKEEMHLQLQTGIQPIRSVFVTSSEFKPYLNAIMRLEKNLIKDNSICGSEAKLIIQSLASKKPTLKCISSNRISTQMTEDIVFKAYYALPSAK